MRLLKKMAACESEGGWGYHRGTTGCHTPQYKNKDINKKLKGWSGVLRSSDLWLVTAREGEREKMQSKVGKKQLSMKGRVRNRKRETTNETQTEEKQKK